MARTILAGTVTTIELTGQTEFNIPFEYLTRKFVIVTLLGVDRKILTLNTDYRFVSKTRISLANPTPAGYDKIELRRVTSTKERLVDFHDGSILRATELNTAQLQTLHVAEEARDWTTSDGMGLDDNFNYNARNRRITNLAEGVDTTDAVNLGQALRIAEQGGSFTLREELASNSGANMIGTPSGTVQHNIAWLRKSAATWNTNMYKYKLVKRLAMNPPMVMEVIQANNYKWLYPQAFTYGRNGDVWLVSLTNDNIAAWAIRYNSQGVVTSMFQCGSYTSETAHFYTEGGVDWLVTGEKGALRFYNVTNIPEGISTQQPAQTQSPDHNFMGCGFSKDRMLCEEQTLPLGTTVPRNRFFVWNTKTQKREQSYTVPLTTLGIETSGAYSDVMHKTQGIACSPEGLYLAHGKNSEPFAETISSGVGVSLVDWQGDVKGSGLISAKAFSDFLVSQGCVTPSRMENEGICMGPDGFPHILNCYTLGFNNVEGIAICSIGDPLGSVDLSSGALAINAGNYYGRSKDKTLVNPLTGGVMASMGDIFDYMKIVNLQEYSFYTTDVNVTDLDGQLISSSTLVRIYNQSNYAFYYELLNYYSHTMWLSTENTRQKRLVAQMPTTGKTGDVSVNITGSAAARANSSGRGTTIYGTLAGDKLTTGETNAFFGWGAGHGMVTGRGNSHFGTNAGGKTIDGGFNNFDFTTCLGQDSKVSGEKQLQLGGAGTTTYAYGTVQNRSDARDKADVEDTVLGIEFIMGLRPVDGRWDMRDDYLEVDEESGAVTRLARDGSKKRTRKHHWFIAQEVKALCDKLGVDFGGYQDHKINGGCDVLTLGYDEFIPPTVKAVQDCWKRMDEMEARIAELEGLAKK